MRWCVPGSFLLLKPLRSMETQSLRRFRLVVVFHLQSRHQQVAHIGCWTERRFYRAKPVDRWHCRITPLPFRSCLGLMRDRGKLLSQASVSTHPLVLWWVLLSCSACKELDDVWVKTLCDHDMSSFGSFRIEYSNLLGDWTLSGASIFERLPLEFRDGLQFYPMSDRSGWHIPDVCFLTLLSRNVSVALCPFFVKLYMQHCDCHGDLS